MKKIIILLIGIVVVSCTKSLEEDLLTNPSLNGLKSEDDVKAALTGAYAGLLGSSNPGYYGRNYLYLREVPTDNLLGTGARKDFDNFTLGTSNTIVVNTYNDIYAMILKANLLIDNVDKAEIDKDLIKWYKAQAQFLVALGYSDLTSLFGPVVLITSSVNDIEDKPSRSSLEDVEQHILTLLEEAIPNLEKEESEDLPGAATLGAGYALKMKLHLKRKEWEKVDKTADLIMQLGRYSLLPNVEDLYAIGNSFNEEIIFSVKTTGDPFGKSLNALAAGSTDIAQHQYDGQNDYWGFGTFRGELKVYYSYDPSDERFIKLFRHSFIDRKGKTVGPKTLDNKNNPEVNKSLPYIYSEKYPHPLAGTETDLRTDIYHGSTLFVFRYAEVLLAKAEALNEINGPSAEVYNLINEVRNRANLPNLETTGSFDQASLRDAIFQERQWEFFMEGYRRDDLIRQGTFVEKIKDSHLKSSDVINVQECHQLFPIPEIERSLNTNITQNECY
ncbi:RagB/SusD family nutrient uptake outer membrane protein [Algibacter mikhailovii]|uniref:RagB/SusD family nutrient uptake outer membrane protein n=1 Tax=Algibacter mikhailovii TaxID=425498 RepID=A0A918RAX9_9FLAO|nr:RagB/SusD family nutrient uptake outer membrane protein [Algibacter mikhailovii]GGZ92084.1 hypothetical protein GCM10007028_33180 [Algibacter mikhailovii]